MIVVRVELWSAITGERTELARMRISNDGTGTAKARNYRGQTLTGRSTRDLDKGAVNRDAAIYDWPAERLHVWNLVTVMLTAMGYGHGR